MQNAYIHPSIYPSLSLAARSNDLTSLRPRDIRASCVHLQSHSQLVPLLPRGNLLKLPLRYALDEPVQPGKDLGNILLVENLALRRPDQRLDAEQRPAVEVLAQPLVDLGQDLAHEGGVVALVAGEDLVDVAGGDELVGGDALAHDQGLVRPADAEALHEGARGAALGHEPERREGRQQEGVRGRVDEVGEGRQRRREPDRRPVERRDQDLGVAVEGPRQVQVAGDEGVQPVLVRVRGGRLAPYGDVGAAGVEGGQLMVAWLWLV